MKPDIYIETWKSSARNREDHYYVGKGKPVYLFGFNPALVNLEQKKAIFKILGIKNVKKYGKSN